MLTTVETTMATTEATTTTTVVTEATTTTIKAATATEINNRTVVIIISSRIVDKKLPELMQQCLQKVKVMPELYPHVTSATCIILDHVRLLVATVEELVI